MTQGTSGKLDQLNYYYYLHPFNGLFPGQPG